MNTPYKRNMHFQRFWKKKLSEKKIKANFIVCRTTLCTQNIKFCMQKNFFRKKFVCVRNSICGWKKLKIFWVNFQNYSKKFLCRHQKNASHTISIYGNSMIGIFLKKTKTSVFYHQTVLLESNSHRNNLEIVWKLYDKHFSTHLMYGIVW